MTHRRINQSINFIVEILLQLRTAAAQHGHPAGRQVPQQPVAELVIRGGQDLKDRHRRRRHGPAHPPACLEAPMELRFGNLVGHDRLPF